MLTRAVRAVFCARSREFFENPECEPWKHCALRLSGIVCQLRIRPRLIGGSCDALRFGLPKKARENFTL
jgi:hypothetical protein